jgi:glycosyltransferase involved in cell wall biosynthesis
MAGDKLQIAIVCDWLLGIGGAERVVLELHKLYPEAPIYTSQYDPKKIDWFDGADVRTTWLQKLPKSLKKFLPVLRAWAFSRLDLSAYDVVICCSGAEAKAVKTENNTLHVNYCFAPTHYYWSRYEQYLQNPGFGALDWLARIGLKLLVSPLRRWDRKAAQKADRIIAISSHIQSEIKKYYGRESDLIYPPVDISRFRQSKSVPRKGFLAAGRQTPYKRFDLAVAAFSQLNLPLTVAGDGPDNKRLRQLAGPTISFKTNVTDHEMTKLLQSAEAFIFPGLDDFGIVPVEAMAAGTPVIAYRAGGALDYVIPGQTGQFFDEPTQESLIGALREFQSSNFDSETIMKHTEAFSDESFKNNFKDYIDRYASAVQES